ncbi:sensor histidine kinase [Clostridium sp. CM028]|uniref:sensor histidine kinase n=2 Tax=Clostridium TaxID=1485 RepID=UPI001C6E16DB|nr:MULTISPECIES: sensor histidine kinase [unclassified Clostridium]MBW9146150.1 sensor histidine kinase [Clostridium sp. CM027]MBW9148194.1 sensor histidine kinase [Clostridium sp. CM028]UVE41676.1 sensor histidine kinase [Clostridium sp. CM027]WLC62308.1 sensor histidine kinase [Clostridium sp. CM028]
MRFRNFLRDRIFLILFYFILMLFISSVVYFNNEVKISVGDIAYINIVGFIMFILYLIFEYLKNRRYYNVIKCIIDNQKENIVNSLPMPLNYEQRLFGEILMKVNEEFNLKTDRLHEGKKENVDFINSWVHEIKTPISACRLVIENSMYKSKEETLSNLEDEIDHIENYVEQALYYSRLDSFSKDYLVNEINMHSLIVGVVKKHAKEFIGKKIKIELSDLEFTIDSDKKWLFFILDQILSNSLKYTTSDGLIKISGVLKHNEKQLIIQDNGIGIKSEDINRVFDKGFTGYNGRDDFKATGMGLYLSKNLATKLGHHITIESMHSEFTRVTVHFPKLIEYYRVTN